MYGYKKCLVVIALVSCSLVLFSARCQCYVWIWRWGPCEMLWLTLMEGPFGLCFLHVRTVPLRVCVCVCVCGLVVWSALPLGMYVLVDDGIFSKKSGFHWNKEEPVRGMNWTGTVLRCVFVNRRNSLFFFFRLAVSTVIKLVCFVLTVAEKLFLNCCCICVQYRQTK